MKVNVYKYVVTGLLLTTIVYLYEYGYSIIKRESLKEFYYSGFW